MAQYKHLLSPITIKGKALRLALKQDDVVGAAWAVLDMILAGSVPERLAEHVDYNDRGMMAEMDGATLSPGSKAYSLDMSKA